MPAAFGHSVAGAGTGKQAAQAVHQPLPTVHPGNSQEGGGAA